MASPEAYRKIYAKTKCMLSLDDYFRLDYPAGSLVLNPGAQENQIPEGAHWLHGPSYILLSDPFQSSPVERNQISHDVKGILVSTGSTDSHDISPNLCRIARDKFPDATIHLVIGGGFHRPASSFDMDDSLLQLVERPSRDEMLDLMTGADIGLITGGQTLFEAMRVGLPVLILQSVENQASNIQLAVQLEAGILAGDVADANLAMAVETGLDTLRPQKTRSAISRRGQSAVDGLGAQRVLEELIKCSQN